MKMQRLVRGLAVGLLTLVLCGGLVQAAPIPQKAAWHVVKSPNPGRYDNYLNSVVSIAANNTWAVGSYNNSSGQLRTLTEQWNGANWSVISSPNPALGDALQGSAIIPGTSEMWAVGSTSIDQQGDGPALIELWNGTQWNVVPSPNIKGSSTSFLGAVTALSASDAWAVGASIVTNSSTNLTLIEHWNGTKWSVVPSPSVESWNYLSAVAAVSANDVWAVGSASDNSGYFVTIIEHWNGTKWSLVSSPTVGPAQELNGVVALSANDVWAVGDYGPNLQSPPLSLIEHWNGTAWKVVASPNTGMSDSLFGVAAASSYSIWAVGNFIDNQEYTHALMDYWNGSSWSVVHGGQFSNESWLNAIALVPGSKHAWAVGDYFDGLNAYFTFTESYS